MTIPTAAIPPLGRAAAWRLGAAVLLVAALLRVPILVSGWPYLNYVDEGHLFHATSTLVHDGGWDPRFYTYPSLVLYVSTGLGHALDAGSRLFTGRSIFEGVAPGRYYDFAEPASLLLAARLATLLASLALLAATGWLAAALAGVRAGLLAAWLAAWLPALVLRSGRWSVDPWAAAFAIAALAAAEWGASRPHRDGAIEGRWATATGAAVALAATSKYPAALVALPAAWTLWAAGGPWRDRLRALALAALAGALTAALVMPALWLRTGEILTTLRGESAGYGGKVFGSYWRQALFEGEWDLFYRSPEVGLPFVLLAAAGLAAALVHAPWRRAALAWLLWAGLLAALVSSFPFRPFRNVLGLVPLVAVATTLFAVRLGEKLQRRRAIGIAAALVLPFAVLPALLPFLLSSARFLDSREQATRWLAGHAPPGARLQVAAELAVAPSRLRALDLEIEPIEPEVRAAVPPAAEVRWRLLPCAVAGTDGFVEQVRFGADPTPASPDWFRGNRLCVAIDARPPG